MTCIVGLIDNGKVWMGGDSAGVAGLNVTIRKDSKVFKNGEFLIGYTSSFRMGQLLRFKLNPPKYYPEQFNNDVYQYMCTSFIDAVRDCLKKGGYTKIDSNEEKGGTFLVGFQGRLFFIEGDFQVGENICGYDACGCGGQYAKGALHTLLNNHGGYTPKDYIETALEAAETHSGGVSGPFIIESI